MIKYVLRAGLFDISITPVTIDRETEKSIWVNGSRRSKHSYCESYYNTWEDARDAHCQKLQREVNKIQQKLAIAEEDLSRANQLTNPY